MHIIFSFYIISSVNIIFNHLSRIIKLEYDDKVDIASSWNINKDLYNYLQRLDYYKLDPPKSLGIEWVNNYVYSILKNFNNISIKDLMNTFSNHFAFQIAKNIGEQDQVLITGGGAYNDYLIDIIKSKTASEIIIPSKNIIEFKEALIFAFLGVLRYLNINNCYSSVTGASKDHCSGKIFY